jgi:hypothetical protein
MWEGGVTKGGGFRGNNSLKTACTVSIALKIETNLQHLDIQ